MNIALINHILWFVLLAIIIAQIFVHSKVIKSWSYMAVATGSAVSLGFQIIWIHHTYDVFVCGALVVMNTYFWIKTRELIEREKLLKEKGN